MPQRATESWALNGPALDRLLLQLAEDPERAAREYEALRHALILFFELRGFVDAATLADEAIDRVARRLEEGEPIANTRAYVYGVARNVAREAARLSLRQRTALLAQRPTQAAGIPDPIPEHVACLERCLDHLPGRSRELIVDYYRGRGQVHLAARKELAARLGISYVSLKTRAHRIRVGLERCLRDCLDGRPVTNGVAAAR